MNQKSLLMKRINLWAIFIVTLLFLGHVGVVQSEEQKEGGLVGTLTGQKISLDTETGKEVHASAEGVSPGDTIEYTLAYQNREASDSLKRIVIATPIPQETVWIIQSAKAEIPSNLEASIDGGKEYQAPPIMIQKKGPDGKEIILVEAPAEAYTHLRWILSKPLAPGKEAVVRYRVKVK
jgi:hypothetical protein